MPRLRSSLLSILIVLLGLPGCSLVGTRTGAGIPALISRLELGERIPVEEAVKQMESEGFECTFEKNGQFATTGRDADAEVHEGIDFVRCVETSRDGLFVTFVTSYALIVEDGSVVDSLYHTIGCGP